MKKRRVGKRPPPKLDSHFEDLFQSVCKQHLDVQPVHHHIVHMSHKWEIDFSYIDQKIAIELQGFGTGHTSYSGMSRDYHKHNDLITAGWLVLYFMSKDLKEEHVMQTVRTIQKALSLRGIHARPPNNQPPPRSQSEFRNQIDRLRRSRNQTDDRS
jgi:very-short-patch-repair endonuclease